MSDRDIVQVYTKNMQHFVGTYLTVPDYHRKTPDKTIVNFRERAEGSPEAIKEWFYPGKNYGPEFVYKKSEAAKLAKANNEPVPFMEDRSSRRSWHSSIREMPERTGATQKSREYGKNRSRFID